MLTLNPFILAGHFLQDKRWHWGGIGGGLRPPWIFISLKTEGLDNLQ